MASPPRSRILAVDDRPANLVALEAVLGDRYELVFAQSGGEAISTLERDTNVDVVLMDVPLVFITAIPSEDPHVRRGYAVGAADDFSKPLDPSLLLRASRKLGAVLEGLAVGVIVTDERVKRFPVLEGAATAHRRDPLKI